MAISRVREARCKYLSTELIEAFHDAGDAKIIIAFGAVQSSNHHVYNAVVVDAPRWLLLEGPFLLLLDETHERFRLCVLVVHDVCDAEICQNNGRHIKQLADVSSH